MLISLLKTIFIQLVVNTVWISLDDRVSYRQKKLVHTVNSIGTLAMYCTTDRMKIVDCMCGQDGIMPTVGSQRDNIVSVVHKVSCHSQTVQIDSVQ